MKSIINSTHGVIIMGITHPGVPAGVYKSFIYIWSVLFQLAIRMNLAYYSQ